MSVVTRYDIAGGGQFVIAVGGGQWCGARGAHVGYFVSQRRLFADGVRLDGARLTLRA